MDTLPSIPVHSPFEPIPSFSKSNTLLLHPTLPQNPLKAHLDLNNMVASAQTPSKMNGHGIGMANGGGSANGKESKALLINELHWWTTDADLVTLCRSMDVLLPLKNISFSEHKVNGKSKGTVFTCFETNQDAEKVKQWLEKNEFQGKRVIVSLSTQITSPYKTLPKEPYTARVAARQAQSQSTTTSTSISSTSSSLPAPAPAPSPTPSSKSKPTAKSSPNPSPNLTSVSSFDLSQTVPPPLPYDYHSQSGMSTPYQQPQYGQNAYGMPMMYYPIPRPPNMGMGMGMGMPWANGGGMGMGMNQWNNVGMYGGGGGGGGAMSHMSSMDFDAARKRSRVDG